MAPFCPCSGGEGGAEIVWLAAVFLAVLLVTRLRQCRKSAHYSEDTVNNEEHESKSLFEGRVAPLSHEEESVRKAPPFPWKAIVITGLIVLVGLVFWLKRSGSSTTPTPPPPTGQIAPGAVSDGLPRLIEIGSVTCIPCKMMKPILDELRQEYSGRLQVDFIDVEVDRAASREYRIRVIPTQVFLDANGNELFRHEGFFPKEEILAKWKELGIDLSAAPEDEAAPNPEPESKGTL